MIDVAVLVACGHYSPPNPGFFGVDLESGVVWGSWGRDGKKCGLSQWAEILSRKAIIRCRLGFTPFELPKIVKSEESPRNVRYSRLCARACFWSPLCVCVLARCVLDIVLMVSWRAPQYF